MSQQEGNKDPNKGVVKPPLSDQINEDDLRVAEAVALGGSVMERIRKNATDWRTGLAGLLTIVTTALVFKPPEKVSTFPMGVQIGLGLMALFAAIAGAIGMWLLLLAANGSVKRVTRDEVDKNGGYEAWMDSKAESTAKCLNLGRFLTALSAALVGGLIAISWYAPKAPDDPPAYVRVTETGAGSPRCGTLEVADAKGVSVKAKGEREAHLVPFDKLLSVVLVDKCE